MSVAVYYYQWDEQIYPFQRKMCIEFGFDGSMIKMILSCKIRV